MVLGKQNRSHSVEFLLKGHCNYDIINVGKKFSPGYAETAVRLMTSA